GEEVEYLNLWKDDTWFINWVDSEPKLADIDLQNYFYFTRESLQISAYKNSYMLSNEAGSILKNLYSGSDSLRGEAIRKVVNISDFECGEILKSLFVSIEESSDIESSLFKAFIEWGRVREILYSDVLAKLSTLPAKKLKASFIPGIFEFAQKTNKLKEIRELALKWSKE
ncbi:hypothetical protein HX079_18680, partial [Myroides odoratimimus]|uniref:hypothetical protein n=1 Tax=Myroides odoratimimus TaxID=76832 RepID=UPI002577A62D